MHTFAQNNFPCKPYGFRENSELKLSKPLCHAHIARKNLKIILPLLFLEQAFNFLFIMQ